MPSYLPNAIEIYCERHMFPHFARLMDDFTFRADDYRPSVAQLAGIVYINEIALVHDGICLGNDQFLCTIDGSSHGRVDNDFGALPHQRASRLWNPPVIANGDPKTTNLWNIEYDELISGLDSLFIRQEGIHFAVSRDDPALRVDDRRGVENIFSHTFINRSGDKPYTMFLRQSLIAGFGRSWHGFGKTYVWSK